MDAPVVLEKAVSLAQAARVIGVTQTRVEEAINRGELTCYLEPTELFRWLNKLEHALTNPEHATDIVGHARAKLEHWLQSPTLVLR